MKVYWEVREQMEQYMYSVVIEVFEFEVLILWLKEDVVNKILEVEVWMKQVKIKDDKILELEEMFFKKFVFVEGEVSIL